MSWIEIIWTEGPDGNVGHIAANGVTVEEVEHVLANRLDTDVSESSGRPIAFGNTAAGRFLAVVYEPIDDVTVYPITAFAIEE